MSLSPIGLQALAQQNVVELVFTRRHPKEGWSIGRRMLCTLNRKLLNSVAGKLTLNFRAPIYPPPYPTGHYRRYKLACVWDILWSDYRMVPVESVQVVAVMPTRTKSEIDQFWIYFSTKFYKMSPQDKITYMNA